MTGQNPDTRQPPGERWQTTMPDTHPFTDWTPEQRAEENRQRSFLMSAPLLVHPDGNQCLDKSWCQQAHVWRTSCSCGAKFAHARKGPVKTWKIEHGVEHAGFGEACW